MFEKLRLVVAVVVSTVESTYSHLGHRILCIYFKLCIGKNQEFWIKAWVKKLGLKKVNKRKREQIIFDQYLFDNGGFDHRNVTIKYFIVKRVILII